MVCTASLDWTIRDSARKQFLYLKRDCRVILAQQIDTRDEFPGLVCSWNSVVVGRMMFQPLHPSCCGFGGKIAVDVRLQILHHKYSP